jgi:general L-amino acid transport system substrate-binding protein
MRRSRALVVAGACALASVVTAARADLSNDVLARVRARAIVRCAGIVRPGIAVPTADGKRWYGIAPDVCRAVAAAVLGDPERMTFRPYPNALGAARTLDGDDDLIFVSGDELVSQRADARPTLDLGPAIVHDAVGVLVHASGARNLAALATQSICVEPGSPADRVLVRSFAARGLALHEHPFQESDEMRQAYETGNCDALVGSLSTLASVRADPTEGHASDRILPETLADDPIFAATPNDARWSRIVWWTFAALVDAEDAGIVRGALAANASIPGVPPAVGTSLGLSADWASEALGAAGNYGELFDRNLGAGSRFAMPRGANALSNRGGLIFGLRVE